MRNQTILFTLLGGGLLSFLLYTTDFNVVVQTLRALTLSQFIGVIGLQILTIGCISLQWKILANHLEMPLRYFRVFEMNMVAKFFESITPALKTGGEAYKLYYLRIHGEPVKNGMTLIMIQKFISISVFTLLFVVFLSITVLMGVALDNVFHLSVIGVIVLLILTIITVTVTVFIKRQTLNDGRFFPLLLKRVTLLKNNPLALFTHVLLSILIWLMYGVKTSFIVYSLGVDLSFVLSTLTTYSAYLISMIPVTPGGLGTFEGTFVFMLPQFGILSGTALGIVMTLRLATFWFQLALSALYLFCKFSIGRWRRYATM